MLGLCCQFIEPRKKRTGEIVYENIIDEKNLQLGCFRDGKYTKERIRDTYRNNVQSHINIIPKLLEYNIKSFRLSSTLLPLWEFNKESIKDDEVLAALLAKLGKLFIENSIRVTTHPGQFTVISSDNPSVVKNSITELECHAWVFDMMGLPQTPFHAINIHGGKGGRSSNLISCALSLADNIRNRLTFENDEKCYSVSQLLEVNSKTGIPVVFDTHHYCFNDGDISFEDAFYSTMQTWKNIKPLQHISNTEPGMEDAPFNQKRAHSNLIHKIPDLQLQSIKLNEVDVDVEAKHKNIAILDMRNKFDILC